MPAENLINIFYYVFSFGFQNVALMMIAIFLFVGVLLHKANIPMALALPIILILGWGISAAFGVGFEAIYYLTALGGFLVLAYAIVKVFFKW